MLETNDPIWGIDLTKKNLLEFIEERLPSSILGVDLNFGWVDPSINVDIKQDTPEYIWKILNRKSDELGVNLWLDNFGFLHFLNIDDFSISAVSHSVDTSNIKTSRINGRSSLYASKVVVHRTVEDITTVLEVEAEDDRLNIFGESIKIINGKPGENLTAIGKAYLNSHHTPEGDYVATIKENSIESIKAGDILEINDPKHDLIDKRILGEVTSILKQISPINNDSWEHLIVAPKGHWGNIRRGTWSSFRRER